MGEPKFAPCKGLDETEGENCCWTEFGGNEGRRKMPVVDFEADIVFTKLSLKTVLI
jgi:hypothetical protein